MLKYRLPMLVLALAGSPVMAKPMIPKLPGKSELLANLPGAKTVETRLDADLNADGIRDTIAVIRGQDERKLVVMLGYSYETDMGYRPVGTMAMDISPLGTAKLSVKNGTLLVDDLSGGTTAVSSLYRFRYEKSADKMRLIGDDVTLYSRTNAHGSTEVSTNRLTGIRITKRNELSGEGENASLIPGRPVTTRVPRNPIYMEEAPDPSDTVGLGG